MWWNTGILLPTKDWPFASRHIPLLYLTSLETPDRLYNRIPASGNLFNFWGNINDPLPFSLALQVKTFQHFNSSYLRVQLTFVQCVHNALNLQALWAHTIIIVNQYYGRFSNFFQGTIIIHSCFLFSLVGHLLPGSFPHNSLIILLTQLEALTHHQSPRPVHLWTYTPDCSHSEDTCLPWGTTWIPDTAGPPV